MNRRKFIAGVACGVTGVSAGCVDRLESIAGDIEFEEPAASGEVHQRAETFEVEVPNAEELFVSTVVRDDGSGGRGEMALYGPDGEKVDSTSFTTSVGTSRVLTPETSGTHTVTVSPGGDRQVRLQVSISLVEEDEE